MTKYKYGSSSSFYTDTHSCGRCSEGFGEIDPIIDTMSDDLSALIQHVTNDNSVVLTPKHDLIGETVTDIGDEITHVFCDKYSDVTVVIFTNPTPYFPEIV